MDDFEYGVEISERDWECFFVECEDCNLLPPSLAGVESGMSDFDDTGSMFAKRIQKVDLTAGFSEAEHPIDDPPDCESSPVDHYLIKHGVSGMESILSGSEEDIHLQSVNMFFERLKNVTEAERDTEPSQVAAGKYREAKQEEKCCNVGQRASSSTLSKNMPKSNYLPARDETAVGKKTMEHAYTIRDLNTMKKHKPCSNISSEPAASNFILKTNKSAHPEIELFIREKACAETRVNEAAQQNQSPYSTDGVVSSEPTSDADTRMKVKMCTPLDVKQEDLLTSQLILSKKCSDSFSFPEMVTHVKWKEDQIPHVLQSDAMSSKKTTSLDLSPSASLKRKRRKKRRLSVETAESLHRYERPYFVKQSDSEEEQYAWRRGTGLCVSQDINLFHLNEPQKKVVSSLPTYSAISKLPVMISPKEIKVKDLSHFSCQSDGQCQYLPESTVRQGRCKASDSTEKNTTNDTSVTPRSQADASKMSTLNNSGDVATDLQPSSKLQVEESTVLNTYTVLPLSTSKGVTCKTDLVTDTANCGRNDAHARSLQESDHLNHSIICHEEHNPEYCTAEVKSVTNSILPSTESNDMAVEVSQIDKLSAAKSVLAIKAGNSCIDNNTLCQREAELRQQLEMDCHYTDQFSSTLEKTHLPLSATGISSCDTLDPKPKQFKTRACPLLEETSSQVDSAKLTVETSNSLPDKDCPSKGLSSLDVNITALQTEPSAVLHTLSPFDGKSELAAFPIMTCQSGNPFLSGEINLTGKSQSNTISSMSADVLTSASHLSRVSACTLDTKSVMSLLNENITDMSVSNSLSVSQNDSGGHEGKTSLALAKLEEGDGTSEPKSQSISSDTTYSTCDLAVEAEVPVPASKAECEPEKPPDSKHSVFAMSSFWNEMEKLTINDILGLRMVSKATQSSVLPPLQESDEIDMFHKTDSGFCSQVESLPEQTNEESHNPNSIESSSSSVMAVNSPCSRGVMWEREPVHVNPADDIYPENTMLTSVNNISQSVLPGSVQTCPRKISKNVSVHNLPALDSGSFSRTWKGQTLQSLDKGELEKVECLTDGHMSKHDKDVDCSASSPTESYRMSLTDVFQYLFGGKQSIPDQTATDNTTFCCTDGDSVPETYDHFFSEYDTESFFYPLIPAEDKAKDKLVPIFSCSRSAQRNIEYPESYDHFFASSSDNDSSDEEEDRGPVRVVSRFNRTSSASQLYRDEYENFFTDRDVKQDFFWKNTFSFRNMNITGSTVQKQTLTNPLPLAPVRQSGRSLRRTSHPIDALGNRDAMISDPLLYYLDDTFSRQLAQQPLKYEDFEKSISNPRLDAPLLPLGQSDMCLVCIAFASWVLKTANPQVGDAWKAVLLANVSALSAIRYLRKNAKKELTAAEKK